MVEISTLDRIRKWFSFNKLAILNGHYLAIKDDLAPSSAADKAEASYLSSEFENYYKKTNRLSNWRLFFYVILYATLFTSVIKLIPLLNFLVEFIELGNALLGSTIAFVIIFLLSVKINMNIQRMQSCMMHLTYFYSKNKNRDYKKALKGIGKVI